MDDMGLAPIDRHVVITDDEGNARTVQLSSLRGDAFLVIVGEPGIGKSSALELEAAAEEGAVLTCRELVNDPTLATGLATVYVDALDEYRSSGDGKDKVLQLAKALRQANTRRWRVTCR